MREQRPGHGIDRNGRWVDEETLKAFPGFLRSTNKKGEVGHTLPLTASRCHAVIAVVFRSGMDAYVLPFRH
jgi:hypothetical protein